MSAELRKECISMLLKKNCHLKSKVFISSQYHTDLNVPAHQQIDYWILFASHSEEKLERMFESMDLSCTFPQFLQLYRYANSEPYCFLYVDARGDTFCKNFTELIKAI